MRLTLTDDEGVVIDSWVLSRNEPIGEQDPDVFSAVAKEAAKVTSEKIEAELTAWCLRADAEEGGVR